MCCVWRFFCLSMSSGETLRLYDQSIDSLVDDYMDWTVRYRSDAEIDKRNDMIVAKYGRNAMQDSTHFRKSSLDLAKSALYSSMIHGKRRGILRDPARQFVQYQALRDFCCVQLGLTAVSSTVVLS